MTKSTLKMPAASGLMLALSLAVSGTALAQTPTEPVTTTTTTTTSGPGPGAGIGVGAAAFLGGLSGLSVVYDMSRFHIEGIFGFSSVDSGPGDANVTGFEFGARGWYHLHTGVNSDFSLGGGLGAITSNGGDGPSASAILVEPGAQARIFLAPNFALAGTVGLTMIFGDSVAGSATGVGLGGQLLAGIGFNYFFR